MVELVVPTAARQPEWLEMADEFAPATHIDGSAVGEAPLEQLRDPEVFADWVAVLLANERGERLPDGFVASTTRWVEQGGRLVGFVSVRHELNPWLHEVGGHIGYAIRPSARRRGYATAACALALDDLRRRGVERALITCDDDNEASARTIERNGGVLEDVRDGKRRYWVSLRTS